MRLKHYVEITNCLRSSHQCLQPLESSWSLFCLPVILVEAFGRFVNLIFKSHLWKMIWKELEANTTYADCTVQDHTITHWLTSMFDFYQAQNLMILQQNLSSPCSGVYMSMLNKRDTRVLALPSAYCLPVLCLYRYSDWMGRKDALMKVRKQILPVFFMWCRVLLPQDACWFSWRQFLQ